MSSLLSLSKYIDALNEKIGLSISWALLLAVLICSGNAIVRYAFNTSSNAWLEIQWYLFGAIFLLASSYTLRRNERVGFLKGQVDASVFEKQSTTPAEEIEAIKAANNLN